ncbi:MAG TPA: class GN sortase [Thermoanaerobaculia bacterium]
MKRYAVLAVGIVGLVFLADGVWIHVKARVAQVLLRVAFERVLRGAAEAKPWPWADAHPVARLSLDRTGDELVVLAGSNGRALTFAPGHLEHTVAPGTEGNCVIVAHRDTHFAAVRELRDGDVVRVRTPQGTFAYTVVARQVVGEKETWVTQPSSGTVLTLITCDEPGKRLVVWASSDRG